MSTGEKSPQTDQQKPEQHAVSTDGNLPQNGQQKAEHPTVSGDGNLPQNAQQNVERPTLNADGNMPQNGHQNAEYPAVSADGSSPQNSQQNTEHPIVSTNENLAQNGNQETEHPAVSAGGNLPLNDQQAVENPTLSTDGNLPQNGQQRAEHPAVSIGENSSQVDQHKAVLKYSDYYSYLLRNPLIQKVFAVYNWTKHRSRLLESVLDRVESRVCTALNTVTTKVIGAHQNCYVRPKRAITSVCSTGIKKTKSVVGTSKKVVVKGGTFAIGLAVVATQLSLALSAGGALLIVKSFEEMQRVGQGFLSSLRNAEKGVEQKLWSAFVNGLRAAKIPVDKIADGMNVFLDVVNVLLERSLGIVIEEDAESSVPQRVVFLAGKIVEVINAKAHSQVIDPVNDHLRALLDQLRKSFILVDLARAKREWVLEKVEELSSSVNELKKRVENEAREYRARPEEFLMKSIRISSDQLKQKLQELKDKQVFGDRTKVESAITYLQQLEVNLGEANDIYEVRNEVLSEARQRISELSTWVSSLLSRERK